MTIRALAVGMCTMALASATPALADPPPAVFNFTTGSNSNVQDGNARFYTATSPYYGAYRVRVTGWSLETISGVQYVRDSKLFVYSGGLGVTSGDDGDGSSNRHTIDNSVRKDFLILQFDRHVELVDATFNTYSVFNTGTKDSDATFKYGVMTGGLDWNDSLSFLNNQNVSALNALFTGGYSSNISNGGASNTRNVNPDERSGNIWLIGAAFNNPDSKIDGFKLAALSVIPEPATWAMLIAGFGLVGASLRSRRRTPGLA